MVVSSALALCICVNSHGEADILPYLQVNKLACYKFMDAGRRHEAPGPKMREFYSWHSKKHELYTCATFPLDTQSHECYVTWPGWIMCAQSGSVS